MVPLVVLAAILWFYAFELFRMLHRLARNTPSPSVVTAVTVGALGIATAAGVRWLARRPSYLEWATTFFALSGFLLVTWSGFRIGEAQLAARKAVRSSQLVRDLAAPFPVTGDPLPVELGPRRDLYLIILDEYANSSVLRERFGFDNRQFEDSLRRLGFTRLCQHHPVCLAA